MSLLLDFYANHPFWVWAAIGAGLLAIEVGTGTGWLLWPAASAAAVGALSLVVNLSFPMEVVVFAGLTIVATLVSHKLAPSPSGDQGGDINDNVGRIIGRQGEVTHAFARGEGRVSIDGKEWAARLEEGEALAAGARVTVTGVEGARLQVRLAEA